MGKGVGSAEVGRHELHSGILSDSELHEIGGSNWRRLWNPTLSNALRVGSITKRFINIYRKRRSN